MYVLNEQTIINKGLDYVRKKNEFSITGNHYYPYPKILDSLKEYKKETEYFGNSDQGSAVTVFKKKSQAELKQEAIDNDMNHQIGVIEKRFGVKLKVVEQK